MPKDKSKDAEKELKKKLSSEEYHVMREKGTESAFSGEYNDHHDKGTYLCKACGKPLFSSEDKFQSKSGWPSFTKPSEEDNVEYADDYKLLSKRVEVLCSHCHSHLGHVFNDGPQPTGKRYCINSVALKFKNK